MTRRDKKDSSRVSVLSKRRFLSRVVGGSLGIGGYLSFTEDGRAEGTESIIIGYHRKNPDDPSSDRVPYRKNVDSRWYNNLQKARKVKKNISPQYGKQKNVVYVGVDPSDKPNIIIGVDNSKDANGDIPDQAEGVDIEKREATPPEQTLCDTDTLRNWTDTTDVPGGVQVEADGIGSMGGIVRDNIGYSYFVTCRHIFPGDGSSLSDKTLTLDDGTAIGEVVEDQCDEDFVVCDIKNVDNTNAYIKYSNYSGLTGNFTKDGIADLQNQSAVIEKVGRTTCRTQLGEVNGVDIDIWIAEGCVPHPHQVLYDSSAGAHDGGDSGSMAHYDSPIDSSYCWGVSLCNYQDPNDNNVFGIGIFRLSNYGYSI